MAQPYVGEIKMFAGNFAPAGWMLCQGQLLPISENETLFQLLGTTYGGDGESTFGLPDLQGRTPLHQGSGFNVANASGTEDVTLTVSQIPAHNHPAVVSLDNAGASTVTGNLTGQVGATQIYREVPPAAQMGLNMATVSGGSQPHTNMQPYLCINYIISLFGIFPSQT
jgi:microcystin-dependent protein